MFKIILMCILSTYAIADNFSKTHIEKLSKLKNITYEDLSHEFKGCPENSICSKSIGESFLHWDNFLKNISSLNMIKKLKALKNYQSKYGLPYQFLITENESKSFHAAYWSSRCRNHNLKNEDKILKGITFLKGKIPSNKLTFDEVKIQRKDKELKFKLPYENHPFLIKDDKLIFAMDFENNYFYMGSSKDGKWSIENIENKTISKAISDIEATICPVKDYTTTNFHSEIICKKIWNADLNKTEIVMISKSCP